MNSKKQHSCIILCGGQSRRMGQDKGSMIIQDKPMINHILSTLNNEINEVAITKGEFLNKGISKKEFVARLSEYDKSN